MISRLFRIAGIVGVVILFSEAVAGDQRALTSDFLFGNSKSAGPVRMHEFALPLAATPPEHRFSGTLRLRTAQASTGFKVHHDPFGLAGNPGSPVHELPPFDFEFFQRGADIIPLQQGVIRREHPHWEIILQPGLAWHDDRDDGWTRASIPFALQERSANCTHNGVMTWLFNVSGAISRLAYQISSETCAYFKFDMWGVVKASYTPSHLATLAAPHIERLDEHRASKLQVSPLLQLTRNYPQLAELNLGTGDGIPAEDITVLGMVVDGIHYQSDCRTRHGPYPYCSSLALPSYSTAKSIFAAVATMRIEKLLPGASQKLIASLVAECDNKKWQGVSIEHALDMATGNYRSTRFNEDEDSAQNVRFLDSDNHDDKVRYACHRFKRRATPGSQFVYHTSDTYLVGLGLSTLLSRKQQDADLYRIVLVEPVWDELKLSALLDDTKRTYDNASVAFTGYGLTYESDDIVRVASWLNNENGQLGGVAALDRAMLDAALQRNPVDRGLNAGSADLKYNNGFWAYDAAQVIGCSHPVWVPFMSGYGGITVAMFPNGIVYYYFSDSYVFKWSSAIIAANRIAGMCTPS